MKNPLLNKTLACAVILSLNGCAMLDEITHKFNPKQTVAQTQPPANWQAPLPHGGQISNLNEFWQRYPNPVLLDLINAAQKNAPTLASALANMTEAHLNRVSANASLLPSLDATASGSRALQQPKNVKFKGAGGQGGQGGFGNMNLPTNSLQVGLQAAWELDLYGANSALNLAAAKQEDAAKAAWHEARVAVAAEVATSYFNYTLCQQQAELQTRIANSQAETTRLTEIAYQAGFANVSEQTLALANLADANQQTKQQAGQCELEVKNLTALTFYDEATVRQKLQTAAETAPKIDLNQLFVIEEVPAKALAQRPDVYRAELDLVSAAANIQKAAANRLPKVSLNGSVGWMRQSSQLFESKGTVWSLGPVSITLPIFDGGVLKASQQVAEARYVEAAAKYRGTVQTAVKETESALVNLYTTGERQRDVESGLVQLQNNLTAMQTKQQAGFANMRDVEESKRTLLSSQKSALALQQTRANAWLNLYRAAGGGWDQSMPIENAAAKAESNNQDSAKEQTKLESESHAK